MPWSYYQGARSRRVMHQQSSELFKAGPMKDSETKAKEIKKRAMIAQELRRHEVAGLIWVTLSPAIAGYTLQYSRYLLSSVDKYISAFNVTVFILAASIRPLSHALTLLSERTLYLQSEMLVSETQVEQLQTKVDILEKELDSLRRAYATKKDLGQVAEDINPALQQLSKSLRRFEKRESVLKQWTEEQFSNIDFKVREFDQYICYAIEKEQRQQAHGMIVSLILLPLNISLWVAKRMTLLLPVYHSNLISASSTSPPAPSSNSKGHPTARPSKNLPPQVSVTSKQLTQAIHDPIESSYSTEGSLAAFGH